MNFLDFLYRASELRFVRGRHSVKNAMTPMIWVLGISLPACLAGAWAFKDVPLVSVPLAVVAMVQVLATSGMFVYFAIKDPDRLQSEEHVIRSRVMDLTEAKGGRISVSPISLPDIANPSHALEHKPGGEHASE